MRNKVAFMTVKLLGTIKSAACIFSTFLLCKIILCFQQIASAHNWQLPSKKQILNIFFAKNSPYHCTGEAGG